MSRTPRAIVIRTAGTNCDSEMVRGFSLAGAKTDLVHLDRLIAQPSILAEYDLVGFAGGFSYGDDCGAGRVKAVKIRERLIADLHAARDRGVPMIGACNGFQVLVQTGLLPGGEIQTAALASNARGRFIDEWVRVRYEPTSVCLWTAGFAEQRDENALMLPIAHGEGRFVVSSDRITHELEQQGQIVLRYQSDVNGSAGNIAGICDPTGRVFGLMPHPERFLSWQNHPYWTRLDPAERAGDTPGLRMFLNAVESVRHAPASA
ncbi:MAG: phosphoribosylformylglycinamidine synthase subunit PurQ [Phycisphaerae bacterium]|nr:phosphoribosylformylglycinamidine synthase subunit PurQ [Phycisphaerae bacterium]